MKTQKRFRSILGACMALLAGIQIASAQCPTSLTVTQTTDNYGNISASVTLNNPASPQGNYYWQLVGPSGSYQQDYTYSAAQNYTSMPAGSYTLCTTYSDSTNMCQAYGCSTFSVTNVNVPSCSAGFTYSTDTSCVTTLINTSTGSQLSAHWYEHDSTGYTMLSTQFNPSLNLSQGTHTVVLYSYSYGQPCDTATQYVTVSCTPSTGPCNASFTYSVDSNCVTHFTNTSTGVNLTYAWYNLNNGFLAFSTLASPSGTFNAGSNIALYVYSGGQFCDSANAQLYIPCSGGNPVSCNAGFQVFADSTNPGNYFAYNTSTGTGLSYLWDFGDGSTSTQQYPFHQYAVTGHYVVCLTVTGTNSCTSTYCDSSSVHKTASMSSFHVIPQVTGIQEQQVVKTLKAFPNPMTDELTIEIETASRDNLVYTLTDGLGRTIVKSEISSSSLKLNTAALDKGFYFLSVSDKSGKALKTVKLLK